MQIAGVSRQEAEKLASQALQETLFRRSPIAQPSKSERRRTGKAPYDETRYPHFLPSDKVLKYTIRVSLKGISPTIWRKFECPSNISLRHLTELIIELMGWHNAHLNHIMVGQDVFYVPYYQHDPDVECGITRYQEEYRISDLLTSKGKTIRWEYDFGDSWEHEIRLSSVDAYEPDEPRAIVFKSGKRACPPEDCGGIWGYEDLLDLHCKLLTRKRLTSEQKENLEWYGMGKDFDPDYLDVVECARICNAYAGATKGDIAQDATVEAEDKSDASACLKSSPLYDEALSLAFRIRELEPWEDLDDSDIYAIKMGDGSEIYVATMGYGGETFSVQLFDGQMSFQTYLAMTRFGDNSEFEIVEAHDWADYMSVSFEEVDGEAMTPEQSRFMRQWVQAHGVEVAPEHGCPLLQHILPHRYPSMMLNDEAGILRMKEALEAVAWFSQEILEADELSQFGFKNYRDYATDKGGKEVPLVVKTADGYKVERTKLPGRIDQYPTVELPVAEYQSLRSLPKRGTQFCRLRHFPGFVGSQDDQEHAYTPLLFLCLDKKTQFVSCTSPCEYSDNYDQDVLRTYLNKVSNEGFIPQHIITDDLRTMSFLKDFCQQLGVVLEFKRTRIPQLARACQEMFENM